MIPDPSAERLDLRYERILSAFLAGASEQALVRAYDLGRAALQEGQRVIELAEAHHLALRRLSRRMDDAASAEALMLAAGELFAEFVSPFEMSHRDARGGEQAMRRANQALEAETERIAWVLRDEPRRQFAAIRAALAAAADEATPAARGRLDAAYRLLDALQLELHELSHELRPAVLDHLGLVPALQFLGERIAKRTGLQVRIHGSAGGRLPPSVESALYRVVQDALSDATHRNALSAEVVITRSRGSVACAVRHDGMVGGSAADEADVVEISRNSGYLGALDGSVRVARMDRGGLALLAKVRLRGSDDR